jgi:hypothetical protein
MNDGEIFNTITNGKGQMMGYGYNIEIDDRWRIVMYIRALQHAQNAKLEDASAQEQQQLNDAKNKKTTSTKPLQFRPYQVIYLSQDTVFHWPATLRSDRSGIFSRTNIAFSKGSAK